VNRIKKHTLVAEEAAGDLNLLASDDNDLLAVQQLLGDNAGKTAQQMPFAVDDDNLVRVGGKRFRRGGPSNRRFDGSVPSRMCSCFATLPGSSNRKTVLQKRNGKKAHNKKNNARNKTDSQPENKRDAPSCKT
jgi:hypothetical protein